MGQAVILVVSDQIINKARSKGVPLSGIASVDTNIFTFID